MTYAIIAGFDGMTDQKVRRVWEELAQAGISDYATQIPDRQPHLTLATYGDIAEIDRFYDALRQFAQASERVPIQISSIGSFFQSGTLYWAPRLTKQLATFHHQLHMHLAAYETSDHPSLYRPDVWFPHITLANYLNKEQLSQAFLHCQGNHSSFEGEITSLTVLAFSEGHAPQRMLAVSLGSLAHKRKGLR
ncbi:2'-5' RNA ligase family protein [Streptococcus ovuberis]|uniref:2'-5' RNA ligase family protein n=1 Tax=Streptococcus ovuberis TaxID=1936207 RepID=A0A7X6S1R2_9STRE|nr:2'-5' RNA ligase family protein [Streptococcus ovuberis]NKZ20431.1 2'-5' RNA ligase family protein [Streptococcus ovuberis]